LHSCKPIFNYNIDKKRKQILKINCCIHQSQNYNNSINYLLLGEYTITTTKDYRQKFALLFAFSNDFYWHLVKICQNFDWLRNHWVHLQKNARYHNLILFVELFKLATANNNLYAKGGSPFRILLGSKRVVIISHPKDFEVRGRDSKYTVTSWACKLNPILPTLVDCFRFF
jgi:hypothetical protein